MGLETRYIPVLDRTVTRLGLGALPMGHLQKNMSPEEGAKIVRAAVESGITFIDTATAYGTYEHISRGLDGWHGDLLITTKTQAKNDGEKAKKDVEAGLAGLKRDRLDVVMLHCARDNYTDDTWGASFDVLRDAKRRGQVGAIGISTHTIRNIRWAMTQPDIAAIHPLINLAGMGIVDGTRDEMAAAIADAHRVGKFIYGMKALAGGNLIDRREEAFSYAFGLEGMDAYVIGMVSVDEVKWNAAYFSGLVIDPDLDKRTKASSSKHLYIFPPACIGCGVCITHCENDALSLVEGKARVDASKCILCGYCSPYCRQFAIRMV